MRAKQIYTILNAFLICAVGAVSAWTVQAQKNVKDINDARKDAREATAVLNEMMKKPDDFIPRELLQKANAIAVFPDVVKGAFIIGGGGGHGLVSVKNGGSWSAPAFFNIGGGSFGAQIGVKKTDYIMLFMNDAALQDLMDEKLTFGGDLSFAAGPVGRTTGASTTTSLDTGVLTWSRSSGAFVGASLNGADLESDNSKNRAVYGMTAKEIMANPGSVKTAGLPAEIMGFTNAVARYAGSSK